MSAFILYHRITEDTGEELAREMGVPGGTEIRGRPDKLIRWGNSVGVGYVPSLVINKQEAIRKAVDKERSLQIFKENLIRIPEYPYARPPCVARSKHHSCGSGFWLCWNREQIDSVREEGADYFIKYLPIKQEWRVHVIGRRASFIQKKYERERTSTAFVGITNFAESWCYGMLPLNAAGRDVCEQGTRAVVSLGLDFGAADVAVNLEDNLGYVLEVNTGPTSLLTVENRRPYVEYFKERCL